MPKYGTLCSRAYARRHLAFEAALAEAARHEDAVDALQRRHVGAFQFLRLQPLQVDLGALAHAAVLERLADDL
jgi:hypothetical protein